MKEPNVAEKFIEIQLSKGIDAEIVKNRVAAMFPMYKADTIRVMVKSVQSAITFRACMANESTLELA